MNHAGSMWAHLTPAGDLTIGTRNWQVETTLLRIKRADIDDLMRVLLAELENRRQERQEILRATEPAKLALGKSLRPEIATIIRDAFLNGSDAEALALLSHELGLVQLASAWPSFLRPIKLGDPVVVIAHGVVISRGVAGATLPGRHVVELFSEGLGYAGQHSSYRTFDAMPDEVRYYDPSEPPPPLKESFP